MSTLTHSMTIVVPQSWASRNATVLILFVGQFITIPVATGIGTAASETSVYQDSRFLAVLLAVGIVLLLNGILLTIAEATSLSLRKQAILDVLKVSYELVSLSKSGNAFQGVDHGEVINALLVKPDDEIDSSPNTSKLHVLYILN